VRCCSGAGLRKASARHGRPAEHPRTTLPGTAGLGAPRRLPPQSPTPFTMPVLSQILAAPAQRNTRNQPAGNQWVTGNAARPRSGGARGAGHEEGARPGHPLAAFCHPRAVLSRLPPASCSEPTTASPGVSSPQDSPLPAPQTRAPQSPASWSSGAGDVQPR